MSSKRKYIYIYYLYIYLFIYIWIYIHIYIYMSLCISLVSCNCHNYCQSIFEDPCNCQNDCHSTPEASLTVFGIFEIFQKGRKKVAFKVAIFWGVKKGRFIGRPSLWARLGSPRPSFGCRFGGAPKFWVQVWGKVPRLGSCDLPEQDSGPKSQLCYVAWFATTPKNVQLVFFGH